MMSGKPGADWPSGTVRTGSSRPSSCSKAATTLRKETGWGPPMSNV
jgi:hypothetical protein